uniref:Uncharacterized protein n=1 Tax=Ditylenchus dipsaci TaxID=166011 RepID=A0A915EBV6_9BILA
MKSYDYQQIDGNGVFSIVSEEEPPTPAGYVPMWKVQSPKQMNSEIEQAKQPGIEPVKQPEVEPVNQREVNTAKQLEVEPANQHEVEPVKQLEVKTAKQPEIEPVKQPEVKPVKQPEVETVKQPEVMQADVIKLDEEINKMEDILAYTRLQFPENHFVVVQSLRLLDAMKVKKNRLSKRTIV